VCLKAGYTPYPALAARLTKKKYNLGRLLYTGNSLWDTVPFRDRIAVVFSVLPFEVVGRILRYVTYTDPVPRVVDPLYFQQLISVISLGSNRSTRQRPGVHRSLVEGYYGKFGGGRDHLSEMVALAYDYLHLTPETAVDFADRFRSFRTAYARAKICSELEFWATWSGYTDFMFARSTTVPGISEFFGSGGKDET